MFADQRFSFSVLLSHARFELYLVVNAPRDRFTNDALVCLSTSYHKENKRRGNEEIIMQRDSGLTRIGRESFSSLSHSSESSDADTGIRVEGRPSLSSVRYPPFFTFIFIRRSQHDEALHRPSCYHLHSLSLPLFFPIRTLLESAREWR